MPLGLCFCRGLRVLTANGDLEWILEGGVERYEENGLDGSNKSDRERSWCGYLLPFVGECDMRSSECTA